MRAVNLLPPTKRRRPGFSGSRRAPVAVAGAVVVIGAMGYWGWSVQSELGSVRDEVAAASAERDGLRGQIGAFQAAQARVSAQAVRRGAVVGLVSGRVNWERIVRDVSAVMPRETWLSNLRGETDAASALVPTAATAGQPAVAQSAVPRGLHLDGFAYTQPEVANLMARLAAIPGLGEPRLATSERQLRGGRSVIHFVIDAPIDQRAQDRPTLTPMTGQTTAATSGVTP